VVEQVANYITIDGGTTNTRISLVKDFKVLGRVKFPVGARAGIGNSSILRDTIRSGIRQLLQEYEIQASEICCILAAGMITSEMIGALANETILKDAVDLNSQLNKEFLLKGMEYAVERGINEALFKVRVLKNLFAKTADEVYSFFIGVCLSNEIKAILDTHISKVVIGGNSKLKEATGILLSEQEHMEVVIVSDEEVENSSTLGMIKVYEYNRL
jgi:2-keto-3-deoxy-galactonokinase